MAEPTITPETPPAGPSTSSAKAGPPLTKHALTMLKLAIAVLGIWFVLRTVSWNDTAVIDRSGSIRGVTFNEDVEVRILAQSTTPGGKALLDVEFPSRAVKLHVETLGGPRDVEMVVDEEATIPGTREQLNLPRHLELDEAHFKKVDGQIVHEGLRSLAGQASAKWHLLVFAWLLLVIPFIITAIRWRALMRPQGITMSLRTCIELTFVGQFYSIILPGITGGDLVKIVYAARLTGSKTKSFITIVLDRVIGLVALMAIAGISAGVQLLVNHRQGLPTDGTLFNVFLMIVVLLAGLAVGATVYFSRRLRRLAGIEWFIEHFGELSDADETGSVEHQKLERLFRVSNGAVLIFGLAAAGALAAMRWVMHLNWAMHNLPLVITGLALAGVAALVAAMGLLLHNALVHRATPLLRRGIAALLGIDETLHVYRGHFGLLAWALFISLISQASLPLSAWLSGLAFGIHEPMAHYLAYVPIAVLAVSLPISPPQGLGVLESVLQHFFVTRGTATASQVFALAQCVRFLPLLWNLVGAYWVVTGQYSRKEAPGASTSAQIAQTFGMLILGIDPGLRITGYGLVEVKRGRPQLREAGVLRMKSRGDLPERLLELHTSLTELLVETAPNRVAVEQLYAHYKHPRTAILMGHARGVILLAAAAREMPVTSLASTMVKRTITGNGHAAKSQVQRAVAMLCKLPKPPEPPDVADAIAIAWTLAMRSAARVTLQ